MANQRARRPAVDVIRSRTGLQARMFEHRALGDTVGLVPTMGALHDGHLALVREARKRADVVVVTVFVNPLQFDRPDDLEAYPANLDDDLAACAAEGVDLLFAPSQREMYPPGFGTTVKAGKLARRLEGRMRPGHFDGVLTVVTKLFLLAQPHFAVFGEKDYQQLLLVRQLVRDLGLPVEIVPMPVIREPDGLALSSRNALLTKRDRQRATCLYRALSTAQQLCSEGERSAAALKKLAREVLEATPGFTVDYVDLVHPGTLTALRRLEGPGRLVLAGTFQARTPVRLIDNGPLFPG